MGSHKFFENNITTLGASNIFLEGRAPRNITLVGARLEVTSGNVDTFDISVDIKSDSQGASFNKVYPFESSDTHSVDTLLDIEFLGGVEVTSGFYFRLNGNNVVGLTGSDSIKVILYYMD